MRSFIRIFRWSAYIVGLITIAAVPVSFGALLRQISQRNGSRLGYVIAYVIVFYLPMTAHLALAREGTVFGKKEARDRIIVGGIGILITALLHGGSSTFEEFSSQAGFFMVVLAIICISVERGLLKRRIGGNHGT